MAFTDDFIITNLFPTNITLWDDGKEVGKLEWGSGKLEFSGELEESAKQFFLFLKPYVDNYIKQNL